MFRGSQGNFNNELIHSPSQPLHEGLSHTRATDVHGTQTHKSQSVHNDGVCISDGQSVQPKGVQGKGYLLPMFHVDLRIQLEQASLEQVP